MLKIVDLFCGPGGLSTGLEMAGFETICALDNNENAVKTFTNNHNINAIKTDLLNYNVKTLPNCDILVGGPPCVQFSSAKTNKTRNVLAGLLLVQVFLRAVYFKRPKYWLMENVPTIQKYLPKQIPLSFIGIDSNDNFEIPQKVELIAADYGVPQKRKRYLIGNFPLPVKTHNNNNQQLEMFDDSNKYESWKTLGDVINNFIPPSSKKRNIKIKDLNYDLEIDANLVTDHFYDAKFSNRELNSIKNSKIAHPYMGMLSFPDNLNEPARTIVATQLGRETLVIKDKNSKGEFFRRATIRECALLQSFPITYQFFGNSFSAKYKQVGDAVPPLMSFAIAKEIARIENGIEIKRPIVNKVIKNKANKLAYKMVKKNIKPSFNRNVKLLIPKKEVRGCRAELISIINKNIPKISYKGHEFVVPKWECHLILGEGSKETYLQIVDTSFIEKTLNYLKINNDYYDLYSKLIESLPKLFKDLPSSKILFYNYVIDNNKITPNYFVEKILLLTEQIFPANEFSNKVLDLSEIIIHKKSHRIRMRVFAGAICGNYMTNKLN